MKKELTLLNDVGFVVEEKTEQIKVVVKYQGLYTLEEFQELVSEIKKKNDGTFKATLE